MFTGIITAMGEVIKVENNADSSLIQISAPGINELLNLGDSISVNGVCLTVKFLDQNMKVFSADVMGITLELTNLKDLESGMKVNLELPLRMGDRFGGHIVQGHIDGISELVFRNKSDNWETYRFTVNSELRPYLIKKGSICLNGVSLTISDISQTWFEVSLIPTTLKKTNLGSLSPGDAVNLEIDLVAKYIESLMGKGK